MDTTAQIVLSNIHIEFTKIILNPVENIDLYNIEVEALLKKIAVFHKLIAAKKQHTLTPIDNNVDYVV